MVFSSITFLLYFIPIFFIVYHFLPSTKSRNIWILAASMFFYAWGAPKFIFILLLSTLIDFYLVRKMFQTTEAQRKKSLLILSLALNLGLLAYFKYANFFVENVQDMLSVLGGGSFSWVAVALPIGISFYTFQTLTYSIDIYRGNAEPLDRPTDYMLYIMMFPQLIAGPIVRYNHIADQIRDRVENYSDKLHGFFRFCLGLSKKVLIANTIGHTIDPYFSSIEVLDMSTAWMVIIGYTFQIYFDFSGYSDMAIGLGKMMGFDFPENFNSPYISKNITEFWRRWHMTLGDWMRDYLYIPLGGNRVDSMIRFYFNLSFVFLMSGLWHGASWNFVLWGIFHGLFLVLDRLFLIDLFKKIGKPLSIIITFFIVVLSWVIFKIESFSEAMLFYKKLFAFDGMAMPEVDGGFWLVLGFAAFVSFVTVSNVGLRWEGKLLNTPSLARNRVLQMVFGVCLFILCLTELGTSSFNPFIYFRF